MKSDFDRIVLVTALAVILMLFGDHGLWQVTALECHPGDELDCLTFVEQQVAQQQDKMVEVEELGSSIQQSLAELGRLLELYQEKSLVRSCWEAPNAAVYRQNLHNLPNIIVLCQRYGFEPGWTVIQQRIDGSVNFNRTFAEYRNGFGTVSRSTEFWLGLEPLHQLTKVGPCELLVEVRDRRGRRYFEHYDDFGVADESTQYTLDRLGPYYGSAGDALKFHGLNGKFLTVDRDEIQTWDDKPFAGHSGGGWWYRMSWRSNLNGWYDGGSYDFYWDDVGDHLNQSRMMVRCTAWKL